MATDELPLPIRCPKCKRALTVWYAPDGRETATPYSWTCAHLDCRHVGSVNLAGLRPTVTIREPFACAV